MPEYLFVPQGCYIEISPKTNKEYIGLITHSMTTCYPVVVAVNGHIFLSHADADISDESCGIPNWVKRIVDVGTDEEIKIYLFSDYSDAENSYKTKIIQSLEKLKLRNKYQVISSLGKRSPIIVCRDTGDITEDISSQQFQQMKSNFPYASFIYVCLGLHSASHPPVRLSYNCIWL